MMTKKNKIIEVSEINIKDYFNFRKPSDEVLEHIMFKIESELNFSNPKISYKEFGLYYEEAFGASSRDELMKHISKSLDEDYYDNLSSLRTDGIEFVYFLSFLDENQDTLCVSVELSSRNMGKTYYSLYVKKSNEGYYLWDF